MPRAVFLRGVVSLAALAAWFGVASPASAQNEGAPDAATMRYPLSRAERPLTLPTLFLVPSLDLDTTEWPVGRFTNATFSAALGIVDDLTVRAGVAPLQLTSPSSATGGFHYGETTGAQGPSLSATYRFLHGDVEIGATAGGVALTAYNISGYRVWAGVPVRAHVSKTVRIDASPELTYTHEKDKATDTPTGLLINPQGQVSVFPAAVAVPTPNANRYALLLPLDLTWSVSELFHVGVNSGYVISDLSNVKSSSHIPVGVYGGYTVAGLRGPVLDIDPYFEFPGLFRFGSSTQKTQTDWNVIGVTLRAYADLL